MKPTLMDRIRVKAASVWFHIGFYTHEYIEMPILRLLTKDTGAKNDDCCVSPGEPEPQSEPQPEPAPEPEEEEEEACEKDCLACEAAAEIEPTPEPKKKAAAKKPRKPRAKKAKTED